MKSNSSAINIKASDHATTAHDRLEEEAAAHSQSQENYHNRRREKALRDRLEEAAHSQSQKKHCNRRREKALHDRLEEEAVHSQSERKDYNRRREKVLHDPLEAAAAHSQSQKKDCNRRHEKALHDRLEAAAAHSQSQKKDALPGGSQIRETIFSLKESPPPPLDIGQATNEPVGQVNRIISDDESSHQNEMVQPRQRNEDVSDLVDGSNGNRSTILTTVHSVKAQSPDSAQDSDVQFQVEHEQQTQTATDLNETIDGDVPLPPARLSDMNIIDQSVQSPCNVGIETFDVQAPIPDCFQNEMDNINVKSKASLLNQSPETLGGPSIATECVNGSEDQPKSMGTQELIDGTNFVDECPIPPIYYDNDTKVKSKSSPLSTSTLSSPHPPASSTPPSTSSNPLPPASSTPPSNSSSPLPPVSSPPNNQEDVVQPTDSISNDINTNHNLSTIPSILTLEATLVGDETVYDAICVIEEGNLNSNRNQGDNGEMRTSSWRQNKKYILIGIASLMIGAMAAIIGMLLHSQNANDVDGDSTPSDLLLGNGLVDEGGKFQSEDKPSTDLGTATAITDETAQLSPSSCARYLGTLLKSDCSNCYPRVAVDGKSVIIGVQEYAFENTLTFMEYTENDDSFEIVDEFIIGHSIASVAISGNVAVVGSPLDMNTTGAAYVYEKIENEMEEKEWNWKQVMHISPTDDIAPNSKFGSQIAIDGDVIVVVPDGTVSNSYVEQPILVYRHSEVDGEWIKDGQLHQPAFSVSIKGNSIALGYTIHNKVHVYTSEQQSSSSLKFVWSHSDEVANHDCDGGFGASVALEDGGGGLFVGCDRENNNIGAVYYYKPTSSSNNQFTMVQKILSSDGISRDNFGGTRQIATTATTINNNGTIKKTGILAVGTYRNKKGRVYLFAHNDDNETAFWTETIKLDQIENSKHFGDQIAISQDNLLIVSSARNVYAYNFEGCIQSKS